MKLTKADKAMLEGEFKKVFGSEKLVRHCVYATSGFVWLRGVLVTQDKMGIETRFCFGERGYDYDEVAATCDAASRSEEYFMQKNLECDVRFRLDYLDGKRDDDAYGRVPVLRRGQYCRQPADCKLGHVEFVKPWDVAEADREWVLTESERADYRAMLAGELEKFERRLKAYLKRYGLSKCRYWTYWLDA